jgi:hypothetical protein
LEVWYNIKHLSYSIAELNSIVWVSEYGPTDGRIDINNNNIKLTKNNLSEPVKSDNQMISSK